MRRLFIFCTLFFQAGILASQQAVQWPTNASYVLTSTFGEFRPDHFHIGIDVKTWAREGYPVYAASDGYVARVSVSPWGYGKVIFLSLDSGMGAVYAHLSAFCPRLRPFVQEEQEKLAKYAVSVTMPPHLMRVQQGDIIGYTGSTGIGYPHLHFELRDSVNRPVNPLKYFSSRIRDMSPPVFAQVALRPIGSDSRVQGDVLPWIARPRKISGTDYRITEPVYAWGSAGLSVDVFDRDGQVLNKLRPYRLSLFINGAQAFTMTCDTIESDQVYRIEGSREFRLYTAGAGSFYALYRINSDPMPFTMDKPLAGIIGSDKQHAGAGDAYAEPGYYEFIIKAEDFSGNESRVSGTIIMTGPGDYKGVNTEGSWQAADVHSAVHVLRHTIAGTNLRYAVEQCSGENRPVCYVSINSWIQQPVPLICTGGRRHIGIVPLDSIEHAELVCSAVHSDSSGAAVSDTAVVWRLSRKYSTMMSSNDGRFSVSVKPGSVAEACHAGIESCTFSGSGETAYRIYPPVRLRRKAVIKFSVPGFIAGDKKTAIYRISGAGVSLQPTVYENGYISAAVRSFGTFTVMRDTAAPEIFSAVPGNGSTCYTAYPRVEAVFTDSLSGIGGETCYRFYIDGRQYIAEYDPEKKCARALVRDALAQGRHSLCIKIFDRAGNMKEVNRTFYVSAGGGVQ